MHPASYSLTNMAGLFDLDEHLVFYRKYHFNPSNVTIHLCCIPLILLTTITFLSPILLVGLDHPYVNAGSLLAWVYGIYYILLDWQLGVPLAIFLTGFVHWIKTAYLNLNSDTKRLFVHYAIALHVVGWLAQFYGHAFYERRAPALFDNLLLALVLAPFFVVFEIAFWMGFKLDTKKRMDNRAGLLVKQMNEERRKKDSRKEK